MAITAKPKLDAHKVRADFPIFEQTVHGKPLSFLDSAASSQKPRQMLEAMTHFYETSYANVHRGVYRLAELATEALEGAREKVCTLVNAPAAREVIFTRNAHRVAQPRRVRVGAVEPRPRRRRRRDRARAPLELRALAVHRRPHGRRVPDDPARRRRRAAPRRGRRDLPRRPRQGRRDEPRLELAGDDHRRREARGAGRTSCGAIMVVRRRAGRPAQAGRRAGARLRLPRLLRAQDVRPERHRRALGAGRAAGGDGAVPARRPHDPPRPLRGDDLGRAAAQVRGRHRADGRGGRARRGDRLPGGVGFEAIEEHERELTVYALERLADVPGIELYGPPPERRAGIVSFNIDGRPSARRRADPRPRRRRDPRRPPLLPAADGRSSASRRRTGRASTSTRCRRRSTGSSRACTRPRNCTTARASTSTRFPRRSTGSWRACTRRRSSWGRKRARTLRDPEGQELPRGADRSGCEPGA